MILKQAEPGHVPPDRASGVSLRRSVPHGAVPTWIEVHYPAERGLIGLRGNRAPLSWERTTAPTRSIGDDHLFCVELRTDELLELKVVRGDAWEAGRNHVVHGGEHLRLEPYFETNSSVFERDLAVEKGGRVTTIDVMLPPSYGEQLHKRYSVLYVLDGQAMWSDSTDPFGTWSIDTTLRSLYELGAVEELVVVGIDTRRDRFAILSPARDARYGGGEGAAFLEHVVDHVRPFVNERYRTRLDPECTGMLGSSLGGLFAFFAAWTRPDVFGKAACLSSSFWWADRWAVKLVQSSEPPAPRPVIYLDSGGSPYAMEEDVGLIDGFDHTRSMHRALSRAGLAVGGDVHRLVFPGQRHAATAWAARVALPLQLLYPPVAHRPSVKAP